MVKRTEKVDRTSHQLSLIYRKFEWHTRRIAPHIYLRTPAPYQNAKTPPKYFTLAEHFENSQHIA